MSNRAQSGKQPRRVTTTKLGATTKRARRVRYAAEFIDAVTAEMRSPLRAIGNYAWDTDAIKSARDAQLRGHFSIAARLGEAMMSDAGLFTAKLNRLAPMRGLPVELVPADQTARALRVAAEGDALFGRKGIALQRDHMVTLHKNFVDHGVAVGFNVYTPREDGTRVDVELRAWPIEFVRWREWEGAYYAMLRRGGEVRIEHGDGRWVVFQQEKLSPWADGCIVPGALVWADRAFGIRDRSNASRSHASVKMVGEMPEGVTLQTTDENGASTLTPEAQAMLDLLQMLQVGELPFGLRPFGSQTEQIVNTSQAWQIWNEIIKTNDQDAARIYLGQDGTTTNTGGNYIKSERLFGVRNDLVEADIETFAECILTGTIEPWAAVNFGDSRLAPSRRWNMPDADEDARRTSIGEHQQLFFRDIDQMLQLGFEVTPDVVENLAKIYGVKAPQIGSGGLRPLGAAASMAPSAAPRGHTDAPAAEPEPDFADDDEPAIAAATRQVSALKKTTPAEKVSGNIEAYHRKWAGRRTYRDQGRFGNYVEGMTKQADEYTRRALEGTKQDYRGAPFVPTTTPPALAHKLAAKTHDLAAKAHEKAAAAMQSAYAPELAAHASHEAHFGEGDHLNAAIVHNRAASMPQNFPTDVREAKVAEHVAYAHDHGVLVGHTDEPGAGELSAKPMTSYGHAGVNSGGIPGFEGHEKGGEVQTKINAHVAAATQHRAMSAAHTIEMKKPTPAASHGDWEEAKHPRANDGKFSGTRDDDDDELAHTALKLTTRDKVDNRVAKMIEAKQTRGTLYDTNKPNADATSRRASGPTNQARRATDRALTFSPDESFTGRPLAGPRHAAASSEHNRAAKAHEDAAAALHSSYIRELAAHQSQVAHETGTADDHAKAVAFHTQAAERERQQKYGGINAAGDMSERDHEHNAFHEANALNHEAYASDHAVLTGRSMVEGAGDLSSKPFPSHVLVVQKGTWGPEGDVIDRHRSNEGAAKGATVAGLISSHLAHATKHRDMAAAHLHESKADLPAISHGEWEEAKHPRAGDGKFA